jgi:hypothetical protein
VIDDKEPRGKTETQGTPCPPKDLAFQTTRQRWSEEAARQQTHHRRRGHSPMNRAEEHESGGGDNVGLAKERVLCAFALGRT